MRIHKNDHLMENSLIFCQILPTDSLRKCMEISMENLYVVLGLNGFNARKSCDPNEWRDKSYIGKAN